MSIRIMSISVLASAIFLINCSSNESVTGLQSEPAKVAFNPDTSWTFVPGGAVDIGVGANGTVWKIDTVPTAGGYTISKRNSNGTWTQMPGGAVRIDVDPNGNAWVVNNANNVYRWDGSNWNLIYYNAAALDIGIGGDGSVWIIEPYQTTGGNTIAKYNASKKRFYSVYGGGLNITVGDSIPYVVNDSGNVYGYSGSGDYWYNLNGSAQDIGANSNGWCWAIGREPANGGYTIKYRNNNNYDWVTVFGGGVRIDVAPNGAPWVVNSNGAIYRK